MNTFERIIHTLQGTMKTPTNYSLFHLIAVAAVVVLTIAVCFLMKNAKQKTFRIFVFVCWFVILLLEVYKQLVFSFSLTDNKAVWDFQWYAFPFQLCSVQLYLLPFVVFLKDGKIRNAIMAFLSLFSFFGGLVVFIYPNDVFVPMIGINIQTMVHHGLQVLLGIFFIVYNRKKLGIKYYLSSLIVFAVCLCVAMALNFIVPNFTEETFNMFYISPKFDCTLPVLSVIYPKVPYVVFLLLYIVGYSFIGLVFFLIFYAFAKLLNKERLSKSNKPKLILSTIFVAIEIAFGVLILFVDTGITKYLEFSSIALAALFPIIFINPNKNAFSINIGLFLTVFADIFLVLINPINQNVGMIFFVIAQLCYFLFLYANTESKAQRVSNVVTRLVLTTAIIVASILVLKEKTDFLSIISVIYIANLFVNLLFSYIGGKKSIAFGIGLTLFVLCDVVIGLQQALGTYITVAESSIIYKLAFSGFNIAWACYLPSQVIISLFSIYSNTYSAGTEKTPAEVMVVSNKKQNNVIEVETGETTIINTSNANMEIVRKNNGKTATKINITTNNIPIMVDSNSKQKKLDRPKKSKSQKTEKVENIKPEEKKNKKAEKKANKKLKKEEKKSKESIPQKNVEEKKTQEPEKAIVKKTENKKTEPQKKAVTKPATHKPYSKNNRPKMIVRNKIRKFETFRND